MCFSATASFASWAALLTIGAFGLRQSRAKSSVPFAFIPVFFGIQQLIEGGVWISFDYPAIHSVVTYAFVFFSHVFWPTYVPTSIWFMEKNSKRRKWLAALSLLGMAVSAFLFYCMVAGPVTSSIVNDSIGYGIEVPFPLASFSFYFIATCFGSMISTSWKIRVFGTAMLIGFFVAHAFYPETLFSVWCFFAAVLSAIIYVHMADLRRIADGVKILEKKIAEEVR